jgi:hypothetical protein
MVVGAFHQECWELTRPSFEAYAQAHGYELVVHYVTPPRSWAKPVLLRDELRDGYEQVLWVDCDAAFSESAPDIGDYLLDTHAFQCLTLLNTRPIELLWNTVDESAMISTGVWLMQASGWSTDFIAELLRQDEPTEAAAIWKLLGVYDMQAVAEHDWGAYIAGTVLLNSRWNSRYTGNDPHIFHATWRGADQQPELRLAILRAFTEHGSVPRDLLSARRSPGRGDTVAP